MSTAQIVPYDRTPPNPQAAIATLKDLLARSQSRLKEVAPKHLTPERLTRIAIATTQRSEHLLKCTPVSILGALMQGAALGLEAGGPLGDGYLVPYFNKKTGNFEAQFIPGYRGLISLARRSGQILSIEADVVYEKDKWTFSKTDEGTKFEHAPSEEEDPGKLLRAYAVARLKDTPLPIVIVMPKREIEVIRKRAKKGDRTTPWDTDYAEMAKKTAIRRICKSLPMSVELAEAIDLDNRHEAGEEQGDFIDLAGIGEGGDGEQAAQPASALDKLTADMKGKASTEAEKPPLVNTPEPSAA